VKNEVDEDFIPEVIDLTDDSDNEQYIVPSAPVSKLGADDNPIVIDDSDDDEDKSPTAPVSIEPTFDKSYVDGLYETLFLEQFGDQRTSFLNGSSLRRKALQTLNNDLNKLYKERVKPGGDKISYGDMLLGSVLSNGTPEWMDDNIVNIYLEGLTQNVAGCEYIDSMYGLTSSFKKNLEKIKTYRDSQNEPPKATPKKNYIHGKGTFDKIKNAKKILWPMHLGNHWAMLAIEKSNNNHFKVACYDSLSGYEGQHGVHIERLKSLIEAVYGKESEGGCIIEVEPRPRLVTKQQGGNDCGLAACYFAKCFVEGKAPIELPDERKLCYRPFAIEVARVLVVDSALIAKKNFNCLKKTPQEPGNRPSNWASALALAAFISVASILKSRFLGVVAAVLAVSFVVSLVIRRFFPSPSPSEALTSSDDGAPDSPATKVDSLAPSKNVLSSYSQSQDNSEKDNPEKEPGKQQVKVSKIKPQ